MMGRDIHVVLERKTADGWEFFDPNFEAFDHRYYPFFDFLKKISIRGCPEELTGKRLRPVGDVHGDMCSPIRYIWDTTKKDYLFDHAYTTLEQLSEGIARYNALWVSSDFLEQFLLLGGTLPDGMQVSDDAFDKDTNAMAIRTLEEDDIYLRDYVNKGIRHLTQIASSNGLKPDELRICFAFDC